MRQTSGVRLVLAVLVLMIVVVGCEFWTTQYTLTVTTSGNGSVSPSGGTYDEDTVVTLTATADSGWEFSGWSGDVSGSDSTIQVVMSSDRDVTATFIETNQGGEDNEITLQAEDTTLNDAVVESDHSGYTGSGYVNFNNETGSAMGFSINAGSSGDAELTFRFANGSTADRPMDIEVNGSTQIYALSFDQTGSWTTWAETTATVYLNSGSNDIKVVSAEAAGGPNMDRVLVTGDIDEVIGDDDDDDDDDDPVAKFVGNITQSGVVPDNFGNYWDQITSENGGKWASVEGSRDVMNWSGIDTAYNYARQNGIPYKQHTFVWGNQYPSWMDGLSNAEQKAEVEEWIRLYCERYPDTEMIDVVNEPDHATPSWSSAIGGSGDTGHDWIIWAFEKAREYCPDSILILNDYNVLRWHTDNFISIAQKVKNRGLLDAVGAQAHGLETQSFSELQSNFNKLKGLGVPIYISEYDVNLASDSEQRQVLSEQFPLFYEDPQVAGITLWGYIYGQTWVTNSGLIRNGTERSAMVWLMDYLSDF